MNKLTSHRRPQYGKVNRSGINNLGISRSFVSHSGVKSLRGKNRGMTLLEVIVVFYCSGIGYQKFGRTNGEHAHFRRTNVSAMGSQ